MRLMATYMIGLVAVVGMILWRTQPAAPPPATTAAVAAHALPANHRIGPGDIAKQPVGGYTARAVKAGEALTGDALAPLPVLTAKAGEVLVLLEAGAEPKVEAGSAIKVCQGVTEIAAVTVQALFCDGAGKACRAAAVMPPASAAKLAAAYELKPACAAPAATAPPAKGKS